MEEKDKGAGAEKIYFVRLNDSERLQHIILIVCFVILVITGFMLNIPEEALVFLGTAGGTVFFLRSALHRAAGTVMILVSLYHVYYLIYKPAGRRWISDMMMRVRDLKELKDTLSYYLNLKDTHPEYDRFCYKHKFEYFALYFGNTVMAVTGLLMWTESRWSKFVLDIAALMHGMEAILASLAIIVWHMYEVHLRPHKFPADDLWLTGLIDEEEMKKEYPLHYKRIMADPELQKVYIRRKPGNE